MRVIISVVPNVSCLVASRVELRRIGQNNSGSGRRTGKRDRQHQHGETALAAAGAIRKYFRMRVGTARVTVVVIAEDMVQREMAVECEGHCRAGRDGLTCPLTNPARRCERTNVSMCAARCRAHSPSWLLWLAAQGL